MTDDEIVCEAVEFVNSIFLLHTPLDKHSAHVIRISLGKDKLTWQSVENLGDRMTLALGHAIGLKKGLGK